MENWSFPARYDEDYLPARGRAATGSRRARPCRRPSANARSWSGCRSSALTPTSMRRSTGANGTRPDFIPPAEIAGRFRERFRSCRRRICARRKTRVPPFGDYLCVPESEVFHIHGTSGTTGRPTAFAIGRNDWRAIANAHARIMWGMGLRPGDTICVAAIFSLYMGSWGALAGAERLGAKCFPFGAGVPGMSARCAQWLDMIKPTALLRHADLRAASGAGRAQTKASIRAISGSRSCSFPASRARRSPACATRSRRSTAPRCSIAARWRKCRPG